MEIEIIPAIIPQNFEHLKSQLFLVRGLAPVVQIDVADGIFAPTITWPYGGGDKEIFSKILEGEEKLPFWEDFNFEAHLMIESPENSIDDWLSVGASSLVIHFESSDNLNSLIEKITSRNIVAGLALLPKTPNEKIYPLVDKVGFVQFMGNDEIGRHEVSLDDKVIDKIKDLRQKFPEKPISIDIGVNYNTVADLVRAGATKLVSGSAIFDADNMEEAIEELKNASILNF